MVEEPLSNTVRVSFDIVRKPRTKIVNLVLDLKARYRGAKYLKH